MRQNTWTDEELNFLQINYPKYGVNYCVKHLGYTKTKIQNTTHKLGIKLLTEVKSTILSKQADRCNINPNLFNNITIKEIAYLLGLIWSDGFLNPSNNGKNYNIGFTMIKEDIKILKPTLDFIGKWNYYERKYNNNWKSSINVITNNKRIYNFLIENDYNIKSYVSADKILHKIPNNLKHYFFRGLIDGDGCFYYYKPKKGSILRQFVLTSTYEQDWSYFEKLCSELNITYKIKRIKHINKNTGNENKSSIIRITNKKDITKLGDFIYNGYKKDKIGLIRKHKKFIEIST